MVEMPVDVARAIAFAKTLPGEAIRADLVSHSAAANRPALGLVTRRAVA
jgi:hypothetical protein